MFCMQERAGLVPAHLQLKGLGLQIIRKAFCYLRPLGATASQNGQNCARLSNGLTSQLTSVFIFNQMAAQVFMPK